MIKTIHLLLVTLLLGIQLFNYLLIYVSSMRRIHKNKRMAIFLLSGSGKRAQVHPGIARLCGYPAAKTVSQTHLAKKWHHQVWQLFIKLTLMCYTHHKKIAPTILKYSIKIDQFLAILVIALFISGTMLVPSYHWNFHTPWIKAAYLLLSITGLLWIANIYLKKSGLRKRNLRCWFHACNITILMLLIVIIKDAVTKSTWL